MTLSAAIGQRLRTWRDEHGIRQDELAALARYNASLHWTAATVAAIETGRRAVSLEELLVLPSLLRYLAGGNPRLSDLIPDDTSVELTPSIRVGAGWLEQVLSGNPLPLAIDTLPQPTKEALQAIAEVRRAQEVANQFGVERDPYRWQRIADEAAGETERKAAARLGVDALQVASAAHALWGHGLTDEREARIAESAAGDGGQDQVAPRRLQALRGHVTRQLLGALRDFLAEHGVETTRETRTRSWQ